jgi:hypothetical protein
VLAGAGVGVGEAAHLGLVVVVVLGAGGYGARVAWAAVHRRVLLRRRARRHLARIDPWSVPEPWRGYTVRMLDARKRLRQLARDCPPGPVAGYLTNAVARVDAAVEEQWALARSGAALVEPAGRADKVTHDLTQVQADMQRRQGADRANLASREDALASELRSLRHTETVSAQISSQLAGICAQLEGLVAAAGQLVSTAGEAGADLNALSSELASLAGALDEARRIMATAPPGSSSA